MTDEDKYYGYTPVLSKIFPDFAGMCTIQDFWSQAFKQIIWGILYFGAFILLSIFFGVSLLLTSSTEGGGLSSFITSCVLAIVLLFGWYKHVGKPYAVAIAQRLHTHGKSCTRWVLIPNLIYAAIYIVRVCMGEDAENTTTIGSIIDLAFFVYDFYITLICAFIRGRYEHKVVHATSRVANSLVKNMRSARPIATPTLSKRPVVPVTKVRKTSTIQRPVKPTPPTPPSHQ